MLNLILKMAWNVHNLLARYGRVSAGLCKLGPGQPSNRTPENSKCVEHLKEGYTIMRKAVVLFFAALLLVFTGTAWAQTETGQISGTVLDQQGNGIPKAKIIIRNLGTGALRETASDDHGSFIVTSLLPARYAVLVEAPGFTKLNEQVDLAPGGRVALDLRLQV